jgi:hypothetical protein
MAIGTYDGLKAAIVRYDGSTAITDTLDDAILVTESRMFANTVECLKPRPVQIRSRATLSITSKYLELPPKFIKMRELTILRGTDEDDVPIRYATPETLIETKTAGLPCFFTITSQLELDRIPDEAYTIEMQFNAEIEPLTSTNQTNTVITEHPEIYLNGCMWFINDMPNGEQQLAQYYEQKFYEAVAGANMKTRLGNGISPVRKRYGSIG